ncbi:MAG: hypothetical protein QM488_15295 [Rhizobiaceae bacterium]
MPSSNSIPNMTTITQKGNVTIPDVHHVIARQTRELKGNEESSLI